MARIHIRNDPSGNLIVSFPYDPILVEKVKTINGLRWHSVKKHLSFPNTDVLPLLGTVPDLRTEQSVVVESGLSPRS